MPLDDDIAIIPSPQSIERTGGRFVLAPGATIGARGPGARGVAELLAGYLRPATGYGLPVGAEGTITLVAEGEAQYDDAGFADESYRLTVADASVEIGAKNAAGLARGVQTLRQLFADEIFESGTHTGREWDAHTVVIEDAPRFRWRGMHLDVGRHTFSVEQVCRMIDLFALHRFNTVHLHLTEDQGWRIEIKKYPRLTEVGSVRPCTMIGHWRDRPVRFTTEPYGGFFTQDDIKRIVAFAAERHVTVVPEIDMPGHMQSAVASYPELGNLPAQLGPRLVWGISDHVLNPRPKTLQFLKDVFGEVMDLFPSRFIHIGGDEVPRREWEVSRYAQERMAELGLKNEREIQGWFNREMGAFINECGRRLVGWDEILECPLPENATVMSWRGEKGGIQAANMGLDVVMAPGSHTYFDHYQAEPISDEPLAIGGYLPTEKVYAYEPMPAEVAADKRHHILGAQAQLWTEYIPTAEHLEYMAFPRACALAEVVWLDAEKKNYTEFLRRMVEHRRRLEAMDVNSHPRPYGGALEHA